MIHSFPHGSAGDPVGFLSQHLLDWTSASAEQGGRDLLQALTKFTNFVLGGHIAQFVQPGFFGANLFPSQKREGGIHPIAVGLTSHHYGCKMCCCAT